MLGLRLAEGVELSLLRERFGQEVLQWIWQGLQPYDDQGWLEGMDKQGNLSTMKKYSDFLTIERFKFRDPEGFLFSNTILAALFERISRQQEKLDY
jgi:oxygen-independent coproporphyrinogen-3 oxidase